MLCRKALLALLLLCALAVPVGAAGGELPSGMIIGDQDGIHAGESGEYFILAKGLRPGEVVRKNITIQNIQGERSAYRLYLRAEPQETTGPANLLDDCQLRLALDGTVLYNGRLRGDAPPDMINNALYLGDYRGGDSATLEAVITVDADIAITEIKSTAEFAWIFSATDISPEPPTGSGRDVGGGSSRGWDRQDRDSASATPPVSAEEPPQTEPLRPIGDAPDTGGGLAIPAAITAVLASLLVLLLCGRRR